MLIYGDKGLIGSHLDNSDDYSSIVYLYGRSDGNSKEEFFKQVHDLGHYGAVWGDKKIVYASSVYVGKAFNHYTLTKEYFEYYFKERNATGLRFCGVYGKGGKGIINKLLNAAKTGELVTVNPRVEREFMYVDDACRWIYEAMGSKKKIISAGSGCSTTLKNLVFIVNEVTGKKLNVEWVDKDEPHNIFCSEKITNSTDIGTGIEKLWKKL